MKSPKISVLMPAYNVEKYISDAIKSVLEQTFVDFELIIINDSSNDKTAEIINCWVNRDERIVYLENEKNLGIARTLNKALELAKGEYIIRMDSDDISLPNRFEVLLHEINKRNVNILGSSTLTINESGHVTGGYNAIEEHKDLVKTCKYSTPILHIWICKKSLYDKVGGYRFAPVEDYDFLLRCIKSGYKLGNIPQALYQVRIRTGNTVDLYGYKQLRAFEIAYKAYSNGTELPNEVSDGYCGNIHRNLYGYSHSLFVFGSKLYNKNYKVSASVFFILSGLISTYQFRYLLRRIRLNIYKRFKI
ncbi:glycosyltransferase [Vibrio vulnificus]